MADTDLAFRSRFVPPPSACLPALVIGETRGEIGSYADSACSGMFEVRGEGASRRSTGKAPGHQKGACSSRRRVAGRPARAVERDCLIA
ncbi:hypothetical protein MES4922_170076 [Mesorhizobium ventifaucium]|uniref:Propionyl-coenzyme A carboxylase alpha polypeptide n=1 Tax=Mesorhizobium ventifaucium TaxID=666020 RepID=A0ABM9DLC7_9HYPH|nr:hypothetical protein MES4922_170076 [Mesorhizobium ventifaucium]